MPNIYKVPDNEFYRCAFPRGRVITQIEDDLSVFIQIIVDNDHSKKENFESKFNNEYKKYHSGTDKTISNHRTEMISLFGLTLVDEEGRVEATSRAARFLENQDFYEFFKVFCLKFQFPNSINKSQVTAEQLEKKIKFKPASFILQLLRIGQGIYGKDFSISGAEASNVIFNDLRVTTGGRSPNEVLDIIMSNRKNSIPYEGGSFFSQHGREFLDYMALANLLISRDDNTGFSLNLNEQKSIEYITSWNEFFEYPANYSDFPEIRKSSEKDWEKWYGSLEDLDLTQLSTSPLTKAEAIGDPSIVEEPASLINPRTTPLKEIGDLGEQIVLRYERDAVKKIRPDRVGLVQRVSNDSTLGFDIQSLELDDFTSKKYIEVKTTNRTYPPEIEIFTTFPMSANEWETARSSGKNYYIYRVFLISKSVKIYIVKNPVEEERKGNIKLETLSYRVLLTSKSGSFVEL